jgi:hypothetical protein
MKLPFSGNHLTFSIITVNDEELDRISDSERIEKGHTYLFFQVLFISCPVIRSFSQQSTALNNSYRQSHLGFLSFLSQPKFCLEKSSPITWFLILSFAHLFSHPMDVEFESGMLIFAKVGKLQPSFKIPEDDVRFLRHSPHSFQSTSVSEFTSAPAQTQPRHLNPSLQRQMRAQLRNEMNVQDSEGCWKSSPVDDPVEDENWFSEENSGESQGRKAFPIRRLDISEGSVNMMSTLSNVENCLKRARDFMNIIDCDRWAQNRTFSLSVCITRWVVFKRMTMESILSKCHHILNCAISHMIYINSNSVIPANDSAWMV